MKQLHFDPQTSKLHKLDNFGTFKFLKFDFHTKAYVYYILVFSWEMRERSLDFDDIKRNILLTLIYAIKTNIFCVKLFQLMREIHIMCFLTFKVHERIDLSLGWSLVSGWFF